MGDDWEALQKDHTIRTFTLTSHRCLESILDPTPPPLAQLCRARALAHVGEYIRVVCTPTPSTFIAPFNETMGVLHLLHPFVEVDFPPFVDDFHLETEVILD
jgi:hypothetical protein